MIKTYENFIKLCFTISFVDDNFLMFLCDADIIFVVFGQN